MKSKIALVLMLILVSTTANADRHKTWNNKRAAVALTYDDALNTHLDNVVPALDARGFKGTFYITVSSDPFRKRIKDWRAIAKTGHELGNHTLFHPCTGGKGREWVNPENDLSTWSLTRLIQNLKITNTTLEAVDGKSDRTFAYTCGDTVVGKDKTSFTETIKPLFSGARIVGGEPQTRRHLEKHLYEIHSYMAAEDTGRKLTDLVDKAIQKNALIVFLFHGVGGEHDLNISSEAHSELLAYLTQKQKEVWVAPLIDIVNYVKNEKK